MKKSQALEALEMGRSVRAAWAFPRDRSRARATGTVRAYSDKPMVLIETETGERVWWAADLVELTPTDRLREPERDDNEEAS